MCNPTLIVFAASAMFSNQQQNDAADAQTDRFNLNAQFAEDSRERSMQSLNSRIHQEQLATGVVMDQVLSEARQVEGLNTAALADAGIGGDALFAVLQDVERAAAKRVRIEEINLEGRTEQLFAEKRAVVDRQFAQTLSVAPGQHQSFLVPLLQIGGAAASSYAAGGFQGAPTGGIAQSSGKRHDHGCNTQPRSLIVTSIKCHKYFF